jgi:outer membrane immunogenic protein
MWKTLLIGAAVFVMCGAGGFAADMPVRGPIAKAPPAAAVPLFNWSGFYWGGLAGYGFGDSQHTDALGAASNEFDTNGWLLGGTVGYNWQAGAGVLGVEGDLSWADIDGSDTAPGGSVQTDIAWLGTARVRAGVASSQALWYATGGAAFGKVEGNFANGPSGGKTRTGWTAGGGVEGLVAQNWTAKVEYLYADLGDKRTYNTGGVPVDVDYATHIVRVGLNYKY